MNHIDGRIFHTSYTFTACQLITSYLQPLSMPLVSIKMNKEKFITEAHPLIIETVK